MTVVAYYREALYADRMCIVNQHSPLERHILIPKIRVTPCERVAYGMTGKLFHPKDMHIIDKMIVLMMMQIEQDGKHREFDKMIEDVFKPAERAWFIMTRKVIWTVGFQSMKSRRHSSDELLTSGTGAVAWQALANPIGEPLCPLEEIIPRISRVVDTVSSVSDVIHRRDLKPFRFTKETKECVTLSSS